MDASLGRKLLHPQLAAVVEEYENALRRLHALQQTAPAERWDERPEPERWSVAECVAHINLTSAAYLPLLDDALARAMRLGGAVRDRYHRDFLGWLIWKGSGPPARFRVKTTAPFRPTSGAPPAALVAEFDQLQQEQIRRVRAADGLPLDRIKITSPFDSRLRYNLYACLTILPRHQHRHLSQAERAWVERKATQP